MQMLQRKDCVEKMVFFPVMILAITDDSDREFMKMIYIQHHMTMFRMARSLTDSHQDAEDVVSDACVSLIRKISVLRCLDCNVLEGYIISTVMFVPSAVPSYTTNGIRKEVRT